MQILNGFERLHQSQINHQDIHYANICLDDDRIIIGDFKFYKSDQSFWIASPSTIYFGFRDTGN